mgnify:CR=1 FL=1
MKNKEKKSVLKIKDNWAKNLTLTSEQLSQVNKGGNDECTGTGNAGSPPKTGRTGVSEFFGC